MKRLIAELGPYKAGKVMGRVLHRLRELPKSEAMSQERFIDVVDEEIQKVLGNE